MAMITGPRQLMLAKLETAITTLDGKTVAAGTDNPFKDAIWEILVTDQTRRFVGDTVEIDVIDDNRLSVPQIAALAFYGASVTHWPFWIEIPPAKANTKVPAYMPVISGKADCAWKDYFADGYTIQEFDGKLYVGHASSGTECDSMHVFQLLNQSYSIVPLKAMQQIVAAHATPIGE